jgi:hypothetical protein
MRIFVLSTCLWTLTAAAQMAPAPEAGAIVVDAGVPAEVAAPPAVAEPVKVEPVKVEPVKVVEVVKPEAPKEAPPLFRIYGLIKPTIIGSGSPVESYSQPNETAVTAAGNPAIAAQADSGRLTFQIGQSRLGFHVGEGTPYHAQIEMDFLDFTKASPTVASVPRLRLAKIDWKPASSITITAGQDWDLTQPVNPHGINLVGGLFQAGNSAFMRQQVKVLYTAGMAEVGVAAGMQNNNNGAKDGAIELGVTPTVAVRGQLNLGKNGKVGVSGIATALLFRGGTADSSRAFAGLGGVYADLTLGGVNFRAEGYAGQNAANIYMLTLGQGRAGTGNTQVDLRELGGFLSVRVPIESVGIYGMFGGASVLNETDVVPSYSGTPAALAGTGPGIKWNMSSRIGVDVKIWKSFSFLFEGFWVRTKHSLAADSGKVTVAQAFGFETGFLLSF